MTDLKRQVVVITGASGALGARVTSAFLNSEALVVGITKNAGASSRDFAPVAPDLAVPEPGAAAIDAARLVHGRSDSSVHLVGGFAGGPMLADTDPAMFDTMFISTCELRSTFSALFCPSCGQQATAESF